MTPEEAIAIAQAEAELAKTRMSTAEDVTRSVGSGILAGVAGIPDTMGMAGRALGKGVLFGVDKGTQFVTGNDPNFRGNAPDVFASPITDATPGANYVPQTTAGEYAKTIGEFAPNAVAPGGLVRKGAMVAVPALASEGLGRAAEGTFLETPARVVGALAGGLTAAGMRRETVRTIKQASKNVENLSGETMRPANPIRL